MAKTREEYIAIFEEHAAEWECFFPTFARARFMEWVRTKNDFWVQHWHRASVAKLNQRRRKEESWARMARNDAD